MPEKKAQGKDKAIEHGVAACYCMVTVRPK